MNQFHSHGSGEFDWSEFGACGDNVVIEPGVLVFHPENIYLGRNVYVGHQAILKGYCRNRMTIGDDTWIGQQCFLHSAGGIVIGNGVGIGPGVRMLTSYHRDPGIDRPIMEGPLAFAGIEIGDGTDIGVGAIIMPGVRIGRGVQVGAGAVVTRDVPDLHVVAGVPAKVLRVRGAGG